MRSSIPSCDLSNSSSPVCDASIRSTASIFSFCLKRANTSRYSRVLINVLYRRVVSRSSRKPRLKVYKALPPPPMSTSTRPVVAPICTPPSPSPRCASQIPSKTDTSTYSVSSMSLSFGCFFRLSITAFITSRASDMVREGTLWNSPSFRSVAASSLPLGSSRVRDVGAG